MSAADLITPADAITVDEFLEMDLPRTCEWHLVDGTVVSVTHARFPHTQVQLNLKALLDSLFARVAAVGLELGYRLDDKSCPRADVAVVTRARTAEAFRTNNIIVGAPEIVVEVMSRSNVPYDVEELERKCLANGAAEFWVVTIQARKRTRATWPSYSVRIGRTVQGRIEHQLYERGAEIPVSLLGVSGAVSVDRIFAEP